MDLDDYPEVPNEEQIDNYLDEIPEEPAYGEEDLEDEERQKEEEYQRRLEEPSSHNDGQGIRVTPHLQPIFPALKLGGKHRKNAKKPKLEAAEVFFAHEELYLEDFLPLVLSAVEGLGNLSVPKEYKIVAGRVCSKTVKFSWSMKGQTELPLMSAVSWADCIQQVNAKVNTDLRLLVEELEQQVSTPLPEATQVGAGTNVAEEAEEGSGHNKHSKKTHEKSAEEKMIEGFVIRLMNEYKCEDGKCASERCLIAPDQSHIPLTVKALDYWASSMAAGKEGVSIDKPPAHHYFIKDDDVNDVAVLAARCRQTLNQAQLPTININLSEARSAHAPLQSHNEVPVELPLKQTLLQWQETYGLDENIIQILQQNRITGPHGLEYVTDEDLKEMGLVIGEKADVRDAQKRWKLSVK
ncbi:hypothetical protein VKT23_011647 [Stygiomarasmius scandens]|uniref:SAM domain-containing protein n=1 Tax=Marasmiellus scandens TaxID=2682957 RepID=A0ABR1J861_9AGAR